MWFTYLHRAILTDISTPLQAHESAATQTEAEAWEEERQVSKYADTLEQLPCTRKVPMDPKQVCFFDGNSGGGGVGGGARGGVGPAMPKDSILLFAQQ